MSSLKRLMCVGASALLLSSFCGCATGPGLGSINPGWTIIYRPALHPEKTLQQVQDDLKRVLLNTNPELRTVGITGLTFFANGYSMQGWVEGQPKRFIRYDHQLLKREIVVERDERGTMRIVASDVIQFKTVPNLDHAKIVADSLLYLQDHARKVVEIEERRQVEFKPVAERYRALPVKPPLSEEQRKLVVQAEALREEKMYDKAIAQYGKLIAQDAIAYPPAYYNMALLSESTGDLLYAVSYMKSYLQLVPEGPDARAAQDRIYAWEIKMEGN